ncbi:MAG: ATP-binding protein [Azospirillaceae bacterium]
MTAPDEATRTRRARRRTDLPRLARRLWARLWASIRGLSGSFGLKRYLPRTLFGRTLLIIITPILLAQAIATYYFYDQHWDRVTMRLSQAIAGEIALVIDELTGLEPTAETGAIITRAARRLDLVIAMQPQRNLPEPEPIGTFDILRHRLTQALANRVGRPFAVNLDLSEEWVEILVALDEGVLQILVPRSRLFTTTSWLFVVWMTGSAFLLLIVAIVFMRNQIRPIRRLARAADAFGKGREVSDFKLEGAAEVRQAARAFLAMRNRIQRQMAQRTAMLAGVSHDLRTPLTRMKLELEMLGDGPEVDDLKADAAEMERMIEAYLAFARNEGAERSETADLSDLIETVCIRARREGHRVRVSVEPGLTLPVKPQAFQRCLTNLVSNAGRHGHDIWVTARQVGDVMEIMIEDDGPGIPPEHLDDVFKPFVRLTHGHADDASGTGLGLTIARDIARNHGGDILLGPSARGGLKATVRLPI